MNWLRLKRDIVTFETLGLESRKTRPYCGKREEDREGERERVCDGFRRLNTLCQLCVRIPSSLLVLLLFIIKYNRRFLFLGVQAQNILTIEADARGNRTIPRRNNDESPGLHRFDVSIVFEHFVPWNGNWNSHVDLARQITQEDVCSFFVTTLSSIQVSPLSLIIPR